MIQISRSTFSWIHRPVKAIFAIALLLMCCDLSIKAEETNSPYTTWNFEDMYAGFGLGLGTISVKTTYFSGNLALWGAFLNVDLPLSSRNSISASTMVFYDITSKSIGGNSILLLIKRYLWGGPFKTKFRTSAVQMNFTQHGLYLGYGVISNSVLDVKTFQRNVMPFIVGNNLGLGMQLASYLSWGSLRLNMTVSYLLGFIGKSNSNLAFSTSLAIPLGD